MSDLVVVGAGLYGLTVAREAAESGRQVLLLDRRSHVGGNAYSARHETGIEIHQYGPHLFHTSNERVWTYVKRFTGFTPYVHRVWATHKGEVYPLPINLGTINQFYRASFTPEEARRRIKRDAKAAADELGRDPITLRDKAIASIGLPLYEAFIEGYTAKQWQTDPRLLPADVIARLPVRYTYDNRYFTDRHEGLPTRGYDTFLSRMADHPNIEVRLGVDFLKPGHDLYRPRVVGHVPVVYTGPIDAFFGYRHGRLGWRTVTHDTQVLDCWDHQGCPVMNYTDQTVPYTRVIEWKHFHPERPDPGVTVISREFSRFSREDDDPHYPLKTAADRRLLGLYRQEASHYPDVHFGGRLGTYAYLDMHMAVASALSAWDNQLKEPERV